MAGEIRVGISGWTYDGWRGDFYPRGLPRRQELAYAAERLDSVEINGSFYSLQRPSSYESWREQTPDDFVFAVKGGRFITHMKRLRDVETPLANFFGSGVLALGPKLGPVLWQLPERLEYDADLLGSFFDLLPRTVRAAAALARKHDAKLKPDRALTTTPRGLGDQRIRHALEFRHPSYCTDEAFALLREHDIACVVADTAGRWPLAEAVTSDLVYVRLHGDQELYASGYSDAALDRWAAKCRTWSEQADVVVYFDNDAKGHAPHDAVRLRERVRTRPAS
ncbi:DUF72 domain-containing protein [Nocardioides aquiterrae]|uniref:DUF72 domain-containing protein n=1 Tax=Nocardioides aquiterrae TaxID=203799 RepID=A0ABN1UL60_9ACTN